MPKIPSRVKKQGHACDCSADPSTPLPIRGHQQATDSGSCRCSSISAHLGNFHSDPAPWANPKLPPISFRV